MTSKPVRVTLGTLGVLALAVVGVAVVGWTLPQDHVATGSVQLGVPADSVFAVISSPADYPSWRKDIKEVRVTEEEGHTRFLENGSDGDILFEIMERESPRRMVTRIADPSLPFGGRWIYEINPTPSGSELRITEEGEVYNPIFRFVSRFIMGHTASIDSYLAAVDRRFARRRE